MSNNLPPGVTPGDIDRHFGEPDTKEYAITFDVAIEVVGRGQSEDIAEVDAHEQVQEAINEEINTAEILETEVVHRQRLWRGE